MSTTERTMRDVKRVVADQVTLTYGIVRRRCPLCGVEVEIRKPAHVANPATSQHQRKEYASALRAQICWEALMPCNAPAGCRQWWNEFIKRAGTVPPQREGEPA